MRWCPYLNFRGASLPVNILMKLPIDALNEGSKQQGCVRMWGGTELNGVFGCVCVPCKNKINQVILRYVCMLCALCVWVCEWVCVWDRVWVGEWKSCVWRMGYWGAGGGNQPPAAMTGFDLHCSLSHSLSPPLALTPPSPPLSRSLPSTPISSLW